MVFRVHEGAPSAGPRWTSGRSALLPSGPCAHTAAITGLADADWLRADWLGDTHLGSLGALLLLLPDSRAHTHTEWVAAALPPWVPWGPMGPEQGPKSPLTSGPTDLTGSMSARGFMVITTRADAALIRVHGAHGAAVTAPQRPSPRGLLGSPQCSTALLPLHNPRPPDRTGPCCPCGPHRSRTAHSPCA